VWLDAAQIQRACRDHANQVARRSEGTTFMWRVYEDPTSVPSVVSQRKHLELASTESSLY
jgi:hypothetical protein